LHSEEAQDAVVDFGDGLLDGRSSRFDLWAALGFAETVFDWFPIFIWQAVSRPYFVRAA